MVLTEAQKGYIAGFIDGEGSLGVSVHRRKDWKRPYYTPNINVYNSDIFALQSMLEETGIGGIYPLKRKDRPVEYKTSYVWRITGRKARELLTAILPYIRIKKRQAVLLIRFPSNGHISNNRASQEAIREAVMILNKGGDL